MKKHPFRPRRISLGLIIILFVAIGIFFFIKNANFPLENSHEEKQEQKPQLNRQEVMKDIAERISEISPVKPVLGGNWYLNRFWFVENNNENFYVEYEDGHILRQILLKVEKEKNELKYKLIGYFEPGENNWVLKKGENPFFDSLLDLYEYNKESDRWLKKN